MELALILVALVIGIRLMVAFGAYWTVIRKLQKERLHLAPPLRGYNLRLIISVGTFIVTCLGTAIFQACRVGWIPYCNTESILNEIALFNSLGLASAYYVMHSMIVLTEKMKVESDNKALIEMNKNLKKTSSDVKEVKVDVKIVKEKLQ